MTWNLLQFSFVWVGMLLSFAVFWLWMLVDMVKYKKFSGGAKFLWFFLFLLFAPLMSLIWLIALKKDKLRTFIILLIIFGILIGGGYLIGMGMNPIIT